MTNYVDHTEWKLPNGCVLLAAHRVLDHFAAEWRVVGYGYVKQIEGELVELYGPILPDHVNLALGLGEQI